MAMQNKKIGILSRKAWKNRKSAPIHTELATIMLKDMIVGIRYNNVISIHNNGSQ